ncbi:MAG: hypothetical protein ED557_12905 [Balneola sp.]|nr:MAG: hypothetical protein ED557_12905 [Balneola sp.]
MNEEIIQNLNERLDLAIEKGRDILSDEELQLRLKELKDQAEETIRERPLLSVAVVAAVGFIIGRLLRSDD